MWLVCYELHGKTWFNKFDTRQEANECFEMDRDYYTNDREEDNITIFIAKSI